MVYSIILILTKKSKTIKTKINALITIVFPVIFNIQGVYSYNVSAPSTFNVTLECSEYSGFVYVQFTNMYSPTWWQFSVEQSDGDLIIVSPQYYPQWSFAVESGDVWKNIDGTGSVAISIGISTNNRVNNKYRNIVFKWKDKPQGSGWSDWHSKTIKIKVNDLSISGDEIVCYSPNETYTVSGYPDGSTFGWTKSANLTQVGGST